MGSITIIKNTIGYVVPESDYANDGWSISQGFAYHSPCNPGYVSYRGNMGLLDGESYDVEYTIDQYVSGGVYPLIGASEGIERTANGTYKDTLIADGSNELQFYSDGKLGIGLVKVSPHGVLEPFNTFAFHEKEKKWSSYYSFAPDIMMRFVNDFFSFKNGSAWRHNVNDNYNTFYGESYPSRITFYINVNPQEVKNFFTIRQRSTSAWGSPNDGDIKVLPYQGKPNGQTSRLKKGNYRNLMGDFYADFLRDLSDPRFISPTDALFKGAVLAGTVMEVTIENNDVTLVRLVEVDVKTDKQNYSY